MHRPELARLVLERLHLEYPGADCTLDYQEPWQLLVAAILSAQCTDERVNQITPVLFEQFPNLKSLAESDRQTLEESIRSCGLFRSKARAISASSAVLIDQFNGQLPSDRKNLESLPGVGRKIANLILGDWFREPAIVVDTHCARISRLIGLTDETAPPAIEQDLMAAVPKAEWIAYGHLMVTHGRAICKARNPDCPNCPLEDICRYAKAL